MFCGGLNGKKYAYNILYIVSRIQLAPVSLECNAIFGDLKRDDLKGYS